MKKIKKISLLFIAIMCVFALKTVNATTQDTAWDEYKSLSSGTTANYYVGEKNYIINSSLYYCLQYNLNATVEITSSDTSIVSISENYLKTKKVGSATITVSAKYNEETVTKTFKINVKQTSADTSLDSSVNDVKKVVSVSSKKTQVLLANSELWTLDNSTYKLKTKEAGNISNIVANNVYNKMTIAESSLRASIVSTLTKDNKLTVKSSKNKKTVSGVKSISEIGFLKSNGDLYLYTVPESETIGYSKKDTGVSSIVGNAFYIKNGKSYSIYNSKKVFNTKVTKVVGGLKSGYVLTSDGIMYYYSYQEDTKTFKTTKKASNVQTLYETCYYKTTDGKYKDITETDCSFAEKQYTYMQSNVNYICNQVIEVRTDNKLYLNGVAILKNVSSVTVVNDDNDALIVRKDGSIWRLKLNGSPSLTKVRSGKTSVKRISTPTNVKATKSGSKNIKVSWTKVSGATKYTVYRATSKDGTYKKLGTTTSGSYTNKNVTVGKTYYYKVVANYSDSSYNSAKSSAVKMKIPKTPTSLKATKKSSTSMKVSYKKSSGATGYEIVYSTSKSFSSSKTKTVTGTSKTITGLKKKKTYYVKVRAYQTINGKKVYSSYTSVKTVKLK